MAEEIMDQAADKAAASTQLESGTYEIIRNRLARQGAELKKRLEQLNTSRKNVFGSIEHTVIGSERIITRNNCIPRDMIPVDSRFIFGYNVHMGLKTHIKPEDVFALYDYKDRKFHELGLDAVKDKQFLNDFQELYKYYRLTRFVNFFPREPYLYMVFQVGKEIGDIKAFKWLVKDDNTLEYVDNRSDHEVIFPPQHDFEWTRTRREQHRYGLHPHISIDDRVFVETVGGDLTIKVEDNTESGMGIYAEDVEDKDQTLDDGEIYYAGVGSLILLKIRPYNEKEFRYLVFNEKIQEVLRIDAIRDSCLLLPDDHGIIFPNGYYLQSGTYKLFDIQLEGMLFEQRISSPNGEDFQYFFYNRDTGLNLILSYNLISQEVEPPIACHGYSHFENGEMILFKTEQEPRKNHTIQIWQTPYVGRDFITHGDSDALLFKLGNQEIVTCMSQCQAVFNLIRKEDSYVNLYVDIEKESSNILDAYFWLDKEEAYNIREVLDQVRQTAASAVEEYEKVVRIRTSTRRQIKMVKEKSNLLLKEIGYAQFDAVDQYVGALGQLRNLRGEIISLKDLRYTDLPLIESMEKELKEKNEELSEKCTGFLLQPEGLEPYRLKVESQGETVTQVEKGSDGLALDEELSGTGAQLELLIDIVGNLKIEDPTQATEIIDRISSIYSSLNQVKNRLQQRLKELRRVEGEAEFNSQIKLINHAVVNYLGVADTAAKCEEYLTKLMVQLEELEGKFADFDEFIPLITEKREELYSAFEAQKLALLEKQNKKSAALVKAAERIVNGLKNRLKSFKTINEINGYFASDLMVEKIRDIVDQLIRMGDTVKADDIQGQLKTVREDAVRQLKDRQDLFVEGENIIKFGPHLFTVNTQHLDLSMVQRDGGLYFHMTGTDFWQPVDSPGLDELKAVWDQAVLSENDRVYRGEYLAYKLLGASAGGELPAPNQLDELPEEELHSLVREFMGPRYSEAYTKGLHDADGVLILKALLEMHRSIDLLIFSPTARALAALFWRRGAAEDVKKLADTRLKGLHQVGKVFPAGARLEKFLHFIEEQLESFVLRTNIFHSDHIAPAAQYLCREIMRGETFVISSEAEDIHNGFKRMLLTRKAGDAFFQSVKKLEDDLPGAYYLVQEWLQAFFSEDQGALDPQFADEAAVLLLLDNYSVDRVIRVKTSRELQGLQGNHPVIEKGSYLLCYSTFMDQLRDFDTRTVPQFLRFQELKKEVTQEFRARLRLAEFESRVLSSFVRNKLIDKVYLPLIGANLAKQMGVAGEGKRTDLMGLLLLISPPGYGKTTLMEYIANRLGLIFVKVNGPAIGHQVTSLDPAETKNAGAREELKKLNLAIEMGNNIMVYVDDIQHCNPEFLQKFISLCDAQRKIESVYNGVSKTYDLRGKKVAVVMAGNPYTESGEKFKIPDMLANRADVYNLGDMLRENAQAFKLSFLENSLTSNPLLNKLITRSQEDVYSLIEAAETGRKEGMELEGNYSGEEVNEFIAVLQKMLEVREIVLKSNMEYIRSAAQTDDFRTEPAFKLQGSYRNMNRIAEKVVPVMNRDELWNIIEGNYESDAQTLTSGAESNMLKWKEMAGRLKPEELARWEQIRKDYRKYKRVQSDDKMGQAILSLAEVGEGLTDIKDVIAGGMERQLKHAQEEHARSRQALEARKARREQEQAAPTPDLSAPLLESLKDLKTVLENGFQVLEEGFSRQPVVQVKEVPVAVPGGATAPASASASASPASGDQVMSMLEDLKRTVSRSAPAAPAEPTAAAPKGKSKSQAAAKAQPAGRKKSAAATAKPGVSETVLRVPGLTPLEIELPGSDELEIVIENFRVISVSMAKRLVAKSQPILTKGISFNDDYRLGNVSVESFESDKILLVTWECLRTPAPGDQEKLSFALIREGRELWGFGPEFRDGEHVYKAGDTIFGRIKLNSKRFAVADHLGIKISRLKSDGKWHGLPLLGAQKTDQNNQRLLLPLK